MVDSPGSRTPLPPAELVGNRIREKRLFEARFLFNKFSREIDAPLREQLEQELKKRVGLAEQAFKRGELLEQAGDCRKAVDVYAGVAETAIDYPHLSQAQQRVELTLQLEPLQAVEPQEAAADPSKEPAGPISSPTVDFPLSASVLFFLWQQHKKYFLVPAALLVFGLGLILFFSRSNDEPAVLINGTSVQGAVQIDAVERVVPDQKTTNLLPEIVPASDSAEVGQAQPGLVEKNDAGRKKNFSAFDADMSLSAEEPLTKLPSRIEDLSALPTASFIDPEVVEPENRPVNTGTGKKVHVRPLELQESKESIRESSHSLDSSGNIDSSPYGESWRWSALYKLKHQQTPSPDTRNAK